MQLITKVNLEIKMGQFRDTHIDVPLNKETQMLRIRGGRSKIDRILKFPKMSLAIRRRNGYRMKLETKIENEMYSDAEKSKLSLFTEKFAIAILIN